jgi:hypothetical protein
MAGIGRAEESADDLIVLRTAHGRRERLGIFAFRVDQQPDLVQLVDQFALVIVIDRDAAAQVLDIRNRAVGMAGGDFARRGRSKLLHIGAVAGDGVFQTRPRRRALVCCASCRVVPVNCWTNASVTVKDMGYSRLCQAGSSRWRGYEAARRSRDVVV